jgi:integrase
MFNLGRRSTPPRVLTLPYIPMLKENNTRRGFVEEADYRKLVNASAGQLWLRTFLELAYTYGWRRGELLNLRVRQVNLAAQTVRLDAGSTKNREGREVTMTPTVRQLLALCVAGKKPEAHVLTRERHGKQKRICDMRDAWKKLTTKAGLPGLLRHDLRRSAAKAMRAAGVPESVTMNTGGWKTNSMFRRYAIVSSSDQRQVVDALERWRAANSPANSPAEVKPEAPQASKPQ